MGFQARFIPSVSFSAAAVAQVTFEELMAEHSATNPEEYTRVQSHPRGRQLQFVYDTPELIDEGKAPAVFKKVNGSFQLDVGARRLAEVGCLSSIAHLPLHESVICIPLPPFPASRPPCLRRCTTQWLRTLEGTSLRSS